MKRRGQRRAGAVLIDEDVHLFNEATHDRAYLKLGSHPATREGEDGTAFAVRAPGAARVSVVGEWNGWKPDRHSLRQRGEVPHHGRPVSLPLTLSPLGAVFLKPDPDGL